MLMKDACALLEKGPLRDDGGAVLTSLGFADMVWAARLTPYTPGDDNVEAFPVKAGGEVLEHVELRQKLSDQRLDALLASLYNMGYRPWQAELPGLDMNFTEMPVADQKRQMEILHMALGMLMNAPRGDACIMMAPGDMLPDLISDTPPQGRAAVHHHRAPSHRHPHRGHDRVQRLVLKGQVPFVDWRRPSFCSQKGRLSPKKYALFKICNFSVMKKCNVIFLFLIIFINLDFNLIEAKETPQEQFERGLCYLRGDGVDKDLEKAVSLIEKSAQQGHAHAQFYLGLFYAQGEIKSKNINKAVDFFKKSAQKDDTDAQFYLGLLYKNGNGVPQDFSKANLYFEKAARKGFYPAQYELGLLYLRGLGVEKRFPSS